MKYEAVIGLEVHAELSTKSKIYCSCSTGFGAPINTHTCPVCTGMPGALPVLNKQVVHYAAKMGKATGMDQNKNTFVRLHGVEACRARITEETQRAVAALAPFGQAEFLTELAQRLTSRDH